MVVESDPETSNVAPPTWLPALPLSVVLWRRFSHVIGRLVATMLQKSVSSVSLWVLPLLCGAASRATLIRPLRADRVARGES